MINEYYGEMLEAMKFFENIAEPAFTIVQRKAEVKRIWPEVARAAYLNIKSDNMTEKPKLMKTRTYHSILATALGGGLQECLSETK